MSYLIFTLALAMMTQAPAVRGPETSVDLAHWQTVVNGAKIETEGPVIRLSGSGRGWTRTDTTYLDGTLSVRFRLATADAEGAVFVRACFSDSGPWPATGYRVALRGAASTKETVGTLVGLSTDHGRPALAQTTPIGDFTWHDLEISARNDHIVVRIDGVVTADIEGREPQAGYVGLVHTRGTIEFRDMTMTEIAVAYGPATVSADELKSRMHDTRLKQPVLRKEEKPRYSFGAMQRAVQGTARFEAVVGLDGKVSEVRIVKSLDRELDLAAVAAGRHWIFSPALQDGAPVPIVVTIEMTFALH